MKKYLLLFAFSWSLTSVFGQYGKKTFEAPNLSEIIKNHKIVAILPVKFSQTFKKTPQGMSSEDLKERELAKSFEYQSGLFSFLISNSDKYFVTFQDPLRTNTILKKANLMDSLELKLPDEICKILKVDALIMTEFVSEKSGSVGADIAKTIVFGAFTSTGSSTCTLSVYNGSDGNMIFRLFREMDERATSSGAEIMRRMMAKIGRNFPYELK